MTVPAPLPVEGLLFEGATLRVEALAHGVKRLVLDRPGVRNAFNVVMVQELDRALADCAAIPDPAAMRVLLLEGAGPVFCSGADLATMQAQGAATAAENLQAARELGRMFARLASFPAPVVCVVRGAAIGGGLGLAVCSDFVLAEEGAVFATPEVMLGLAPALIGPYVVRRLGLAHAAPLMLSGRRLRGREALAIGLVQQLLDPSEPVEEAVARVLREFLAAGPQAARTTRELLLRISPLPGPDLAGFTAQALAALRAGPEAQAGLQAYFGRTPPPWALPPLPPERA